MPEFTKTDLARCETVMKALKRGKYELEGDEILAFAQAFAWLSAQFERIRSEVENQQKQVEPSVMIAKGGKKK